MLLNNKYDQKKEIFFLFLFLEGGFFAFFCGIFFPMCTALNFCLIVLYLPNL